MVAFMHFVTRKSSKIVDNPLLADIDRMIEEENNIYRISSDNQIYDVVQQELARFKAQCQEKFQSFETGRRQKPLSNVDTFINYVIEVPLVRMQIEVINEYQSMIFSKNQRHILDE